MASSALTAGSLHGVASQVLEGELPLDVPLERLPVDLDVGVDEIVERVARLRRIETQVPPLRELHPVLVVRPEEIVPLVRILARLRCVHGNPAVSSEIELRPAVVSADLPLASLGGNGETDAEAGGDSHGAAEADEQGVEVRAVPPPHG